MRILQTNQFRKSYKKLFQNQLRETNDAINEIAENPDIGEKKHGDLSWLRVHKYKMAGQLMLIGYTVESDALTLIALGPHENFYRDVKR